MASIAFPNKCSNCGANDFEFMHPPYGTSYVLTTVDETKNPPSFNPTSGLTVAVFGCKECGTITFKNRS